MKHGRVVYQGQVLAVTESADGRVQLPDGSIVGKKLVKSSGNPAWDEAVLRAIDRTNSLPRDENGKVPPTLLLEFRPQD